MSKLVMLKGLSASGKSTQARIMADNDWVRVNKDDIRVRLFPDSFRRKNERHVIRERDALIIAALLNDKDVVVDDTNLNPIHEKALKNIAVSYGADFSVDDSFMAVPLSTCIERDSLRVDSVGEQVIRGQYHDWIKSPIGAPKYDPKLPALAIFDVDGTLAHMVNRRPYDWDKVGSDEIDSGVGHVIDGLNAIGYATIYIFSGRDEVCRPETEEWLERHAIEYDQLFMRPEGDTRKDTIIKGELFEAHVRGQYNVLFVMDDRPSVCNQWREVYGLNVFQCGDPNWRF